MCFVTAPLFRVLGLLLLFSPPSCLCLLQSLYQSWALENSPCPQGDNLHTATSSLPRMFLLAITPPIAPELPRELALMLGDNQGWP